MSASDIQFAIESGIVRLRLEDYLFDKFPALSRMYIRDVIRRDKCQINGRAENKGKRVNSGDFVEINLDLERAGAMRPESIPLDILYEDDGLIAVNKPPGMLVHPTHRAKNGTLLNALTFYLNRRGGGGTVRPGLVHRLGKETSGLMLAAIDVRVHRILARQFQNKTVVKTYLALVEGIPGQNKGTIDAPIGRFADEKRWGVHPNGRPAFTRFRIAMTVGEMALLELQPVTGRTNQLRIHCASIGHPIVGDVARGGRVFESLCLHAWRLQFLHPNDSRIINLTAPSPKWLGDLPIEH